MDNRDGLAGANILAIVYHVCHGFVGNPLSLEVSRRLGNERRVAKGSVKRIEKVIGAVLNGKAQAERQNLLTKLGKTESAEAVRTELKTPANVDDDSEDEDEEPEKRKRTRRRGRGRGRG